MLRYRPPRIAVALLVGAAIAHALLSLVISGLPQAPVAGAIVALLGCVIMLRAWWLFRRCATPICPTAATTTLITGDIYGLTRNPMYLGIVLMLTGVALAAGGVAFYLAALAFYLIIDAVFCPFEEEKLRRTFGTRFTDYQARVRRWL
jgi:protein-S-isoprenylcysteine O-methyltransferase Ste14